jgi:quinolinate synthase
LAKEKKVMMNRASLSLRMSKAWTQIRPSPQRRNHGVWNTWNPKRVLLSNAKSAVAVPASSHWNRASTIPNLQSSSAAHGVITRGKSTAAATITATAPYDQSITQPFPSLIIGADNSLTPVGSFAEAQATYLTPDETAVEELTAALEATNSGIVAHYYMDVELQSVLQAVGQRLPGRVGIADSLKMGDMAVEMARTLNVQNIACLGVDFMSESVAAILTKNNLHHIPVYRASQSKIGCSLAESAEQVTYQAWLQQQNEIANHRALHVVYINTSLETKAISNSIVPTITCTSSNVLQTILTASAQIERVKILYGPDTYMGHNLISLLTALLNDASWDDTRIANTLHPLHTRETLQNLRDSIVVFPSGNCIVHHMFGGSVVQTVKRDPLYEDAMVTAHLEVPGEMFDIAMQKSLSDQGVVGSTSDILNFITRKVRQQATESSTRPDVSQQQQRRLRFILGTEAGMVTSIVSSVQAILREAGNPNLEAEIIFPVASEAVTATEESSNSMKIVPGVAGGEGCSTSGGCATCPFMKMNHLDALMDVLELVRNRQDMTLSKHLPPDRLGGKYIQGRPAIEFGTEPIVYMREFTQHKRLPDELIQRVVKGRSSTTL